MSEATQAGERLRRIRVGGERGKVVYGFAKTADDRIDDGDCEHIEILRRKDESRLADEQLRLTDPTPIDEAWLREIGFRDWPSCGDPAMDMFSLFLPTHSELSWPCRLTWQSGGLYIARICDPDDEDEEFVAESVELLGTRNSTKKATRGQLRMLCSALGIPLPPHGTGE